MTDTWLPDRRSVLIGGAAAFAALPLAARAAVPYDLLTRAQSLLARPWTGIMTSPMALMNGADGIMRLEASFAVDGERFEGTLNQFFNWGSQVYDGYFKTRGYIWSDDSGFGIEIVENRRYAGGELPHSYVMSKPTGRLRFGIIPGSRVVGLLGTLRGREDGPLDEQVRLTPK